MPYIPPNTISDATFVPYDKKDLATLVSVLEERWQLFYPMVRYFPIDLTLTDQSRTSAASEAGLIGLPGGTLVDPLYNEEVPGEVVNTDEVQYVQHHPTGLSPLASRVFRPMNQIHAHIHRTDNRDRLRSVGRDAQRTCVLTLLTSLLDKAGITVNPGDEIEHDYSTDRLAGRWRVTRSHVPEKAYWETTNIPLFLVCQCTQVPLGS